MHSAQRALGLVRCVWRESVSCDGLSRLEARVLKSSGSTHNKPLLPKSIVLLAFVYRGAYNHFVAPVNWNRCEAPLQLCCTRECDGGPCPAPVERESATRQAKAGPLAHRPRSPPLRARVGCGGRAREVWRSGSLHKNRPMFTMRLQSTQQHKARHLPGCGILCYQAAVYSACATVGARLRPAPRAVAGGRDPGVLSTTPHRVGTANVLGL